MSATLERSMREQASRYLGWLAAMFSVFAVYLGVLLALFT
jgi:hypothetical protein